MYGNILIPVDGSPLSTVAMEKSMDFARETGAKATVGASSPISGPSTARVA